MGIFGIANETPCIISPFLSLSRKLIIPSKFPFLSKTGPPLFPSFITKLVCIASISLPSFEITNLDELEITPAVNDNPNPLGFPIVYIDCPV